MIVRAVAAGALALAAALTLSACAGSPRYAIETPQPMTSAPPSAEEARPTGPVAMQPIPNPGDPAVRAVPTAPVASSELPPVGGPAAAAPSTVPPSYMVQTGDTLFSISRRFGLQPQALAELNGLTYQSILQNGQTLRLPGGSSTAVAGAPAPAAPGAPPTSRPAPGQIVPTAPPPNPSDVATLGRGLFQWPLQGQILERFGPRGPGQRNDGINIAAPLGAPVRAAAAGEVAYVGASVPGFGNLVLIRHPGGWVTAYGHLAASTARMRQAVAQGEQIGTAGQTGNVTAPQLHFEVRYATSARERARPVDPLTLLPPPTAP